MQYDWISFYTEFATKLLPFKNDRKALIQKIYAMYETAGLSLPKLESGDEIIDIDPFTIFGMFNKGITNANRISIISAVSNEFGITAKIPNNFDGIPVLNNLKATFYGFKDDRKAGDIDNLWVLFEAAIALADNDTEETLSARILTREHPTYVRAVAAFCADKLTISGNHVSGMHSEEE